MNILLTGIGFPGSYSLIRSLRSSFLDVIITGIDAVESEQARLFTDKFIQSPYASSEAYGDFILGLCHREKIDVIIPTNTAELPKLQSIQGELADIGTVIPMGRKMNYDNLNNKWLVMHVAAHHDIPAPHFERVYNRLQLYKKIIYFFSNIDEKDNVFCVKPIRSNGGRGFRIIDENAENGYFKEKYQERIKFKDLLNILPKKFEGPLLLMDYLPGKEYTVDCLSDMGKMIYAVPRTRDTVKGGISFTATTVNHPGIIEHCRKMINLFKVHGPCGFQFKEDKDGKAKIIECNPRIQGGSILAVRAGADIFADSVSLALGQRIKEPEIKWGVKMVRYYDERFIN
jgi:carbamoyl-phosphate synthase large subunit